MSCFHAFNRDFAGRNLEQNTREIIQVKSYDIIEEFKYPRLAMNV